MKSYFSHSIALKHAQIENINRKGQCTDYILLAFPETVFLNEFFRKEKTGFGIAMKKCGIRDSREKKAGTRDQEPPFPDPV